MVLEERLSPEQRRAKKARADAKRTPIQRIRHYNYLYARYIGTYKTEIYRKRAVDKKNANKLRIMKYYSNSEVPYCACCGETIYDFLTIDHKDHSGAEHRNTNLSAYGGAAFYDWIIRLNFPPVFRVLCWNCNCCDGIRGICYHEKIRNQVAEGYKIAQALQVKVLQ